MLCYSLAFYLPLNSVYLLAHLYFFIHFLTTILFQSQVKKTYLLIPSFWPSLSSVLSNFLPLFIICSIFVYKQIFFLPVCSEIIIAVRWHYQKSSCHYQIIVTLSAVSILLSEYRHIITSLHIIIRVSSHYQQSPYHYQNIVTLSPVSISLSECRQIISSLHIIIRLSSNYQQVLYHY